MVFNLACQNGHFEIMILLLELGIDGTNDKFLRNNTGFQKLVENKIEEMKSIEQILNKIFIHEELMLSKLIFNYTYGLKNLENFLTN